MTFTAWIEKFGDKKVKNPKTDNMVKITSLPLQTQRQLWEKSNRSSDKPSDAEKNRAQRIDRHFKKLDMRVRGDQLAKAFTKYPALQSDRKKWVEIVDKASAKFKVDPSKLNHLQFEETIREMGGGKKRASRQLTVGSRVKVGGLNGYIEETKGNKALVSYFNQGSLGLRWVSSLDLRS